MAIINSLLSWYFRSRIKQVEFFMQNPEEVQRNKLLELIRTAENTEWGKKYGYKSIYREDEFKNRVPLNNYDSLKPFIERNMKGEQNVLWPSEIKWFAKSSGTTADKSKFIPVSFETMDECHFNAGRDVLTLYCNQKENTQLFDGKGLVIGGSHQVNRMNEEVFYGDLSAVIMQNLPFWVHFLRTPELSIALLDDWESKLEKMANATVNENVTNISGVPTWTLVLFNRLFEMTGKRNLTEIWPNLELYVHGGVSFTPYRNQFKQLISSPGMNYMETYNASEGFFGIQDDLSSEDMLLMLDYGLYYEFMPMSEYGKEHPVTYSLSQVVPFENYALIISNNSGLWRYLIGDTIQFTSVKPFRFKITGRTKHFINAFGEELIVENADRAVAEACRILNAQVSEYTAAPVFLDNQGKGGHEWLIEFEKEPGNMELFREELDNALKNVNSDYEAKRQKDISLQKPVVRVMQKGSFHRWLKAKGKLGGQHKVPRLSNTRDYVEGILTMMEN
ncbi:MAG: GH3 auxin-responsive promoter family protein [Bacteroidia bacterium]|nr:GH3 auxin-responsive promoter family protein [Bacteroidia bacterium]